MDEPAAPAQEWHNFCALDEIPDGGILTDQQAGHNLIVHRNGAQVTCLRNFCPHRGWPFDGATVQDGIITCPYHGYEFRLDTGACLIAAEPPLDMYPARIRNGRVEIKLK